MASQQTINYTSDKCGSPSSYPTKTDLDSVTVASIDTLTFAPKLSTKRLLLAHFGAAITLFLATTDATIVSTSLPTIAQELQATQTQYTWIGVSYLLTQTACQPLYGRISDLIGRKIVLYTSIFTFVLGSLLCGAAQNIVWLILARAFSGIGGGGIVACVWTLLSELVEEEHRAKWSQAFSVTWAASAIAGPLLGGLFSSSTGFFSWRWAFYLNLPVSIIGFLTLFFSLRTVKLGPSNGGSWHKFIRTFDFVGLIIFMAGTILVIVGFSFAGQSGWMAPSTLVLIILGPVILIGGSIYEVSLTSREALFPLAVFQDRTIVIILIISFLHNFAFNAGTFYLALWFQAVNGYTPIKAGITLLPYSLGAALASMPAAWFINFWQRRAKNNLGQQIIISFGLAVSAVGFGLLTLLSEDSESYMAILFPLVAGLGLGCLFHAPYQIFTQALRNEIATATSAFFLVRFTGSTVGLAIAGAIFDAKTQGRIPSSNNDGFIDFSGLADIESLPLRLEVLRVVSSSIQTIWFVCGPCLAIACIISFAIRPIPERTKTTTPFRSVSDIV